MLSIKQARKILGVLAKDIPDEVIEQDIRSATLLKQLFFSHLTSNNKIEELNQGGKSGES